MQAPWVSLATVPLLFGAAAPAPADDLARIDRTLRKEPAYTSRPQYFLLVFGPEGRTRVWVVVDGNAAYVDRNGDGDLTGAGKRVELPGGGRITESDGKTTVQLLIQPPGPNGFVYCEAAVQGQYVQYAFIRPAEGPQSAPVYHFHGPLRIQLSGAQKLVRGPRPAELWAVIGTPGSSGDLALIPFAEGLPASLHPVAEIQFPNRAAGKASITSKVPLHGIRGQPLWHATVTVPPEAGPGKARVTLSFPDWKGARVASTTQDVPIVDADSKTAAGPPTPQPLDGGKPALDLARIDRTLRNEPAYHGKPRYCLLLFGPKARTHVWLVLDGDVLYVDRNGDGDLTEPGKRVAAQPPRSQGQQTKAFKAGAITELDGKTRHAGLQVNAEPSKIYPGVYCFSYVSILIKGQYKEYTFLDWSAENPQDAAVRHFNGPLKMILDTATLVRGGPPTDLTAQIATKYPTGEWVFIDSREGLPTTIHPLAEIVFPNRQPGGPPVRIKIPLTQRC